MMKLEPKPGYEYRVSPDGLDHVYRKVVDDVEVYIYCDEHLTPADRSWVVCYTLLNTGGEKHAWGDTEFDPTPKGLDKMIAFAEEKLPHYAEFLHRKPRRTRRTAEQKARDNFVLYD